MNLITVLLSLAAGVYVLAFLLFLLEFLSPEGKKFAWAGGHLIELGFLNHTLLIFAQTFSVSRTLPSEFHLPVTTLGEASGFFAWSLAFVYLVLLRRLKTETFGLVLAPVLAFFLIPTFFPFQPNQELLKHFHDGYFLLHILSAFFGYAAFALSFIAATLYLALDRALKQKTAGHFYQKLPALDDLERLIFRTIFWGIFLLGVAIVSGALWAKMAINTFILKEPKAFASLVTWVAYFVIFFSHEVLAVKGRRVVVVSLGAFLLVLITFLGTSLLRPGLHAGAF